MRRRLAAFVLLLLMLGSGAAVRANDEGFRALQTGQAAEKIGDLRLAMISYADAIQRGLPAELVPSVVARFCILSLTVSVDKSALDNCDFALRHGQGAEHANALANMLASMALILVDEGFEEESRKALAEFDRRYANLQQPDLSFERQRSNIARAELLRADGKASEALALIARMTTGKEMVFPITSELSEVEIISLDILRIRLAIAYDLQDAGLIRDTIRWQSTMMENLKTAEAMDYAGALGLCQAYFVAQQPQNDNETWQQVDLRTDALLMFLELTKAKDARRPLLGPSAMRLVRHCIPVYYAFTPLSLYRTLQQQGLGLTALLTALDDFDTGQFGEARTRFDTIIAGLKAADHVSTRRMARRLELLRDVLLTDPAPRARR